MSILYEYLKILEKKKEQNASHAPLTSVKQKRSINVWPYIIIGLAVFACVLILLFWENLKGSLAKAKVEKTAIVIPQKEVSPVVQDLNTTSFIAAAKPYSPEYSLKGIIYNAESPSAIINGQLLEKNNKIDDWQVMEISPSEVKLENTINKSVLILKLSKNN
jgi:hypothetical protein